MKRYCRYLPPGIHLTVEANWHVCRVHPAHFKIFRLKSKPFPSVLIKLNCAVKDFDWSGNSTGKSLQSTPNERGQHLMCLLWAHAQVLHWPSSTSLSVQLSSRLYRGLSSPEVAKWEQLVKSVVLACWSKCRLPYYNQPNPMGVLENKPANVSFSQSPLKRTAVK